MALRRPASLVQNILSKPIKTNKRTGGQKRLTDTSHANNTTQRLANNTMVTPQLISDALLHRKKSREQKTQSRIASRDPTPPSHRGAPNFYSMRQRSLTQLNTSVLHRKDLESKQSVTPRALGTPRTQNQKPAAKPSKPWDSSICNPHSKRESIVNRPLLLDKSEKQDKSSQSFSSRH